MSRRSGLGRGLAALIPPPPADQDATDDPNVSSDAVVDESNADEGFRIISAPPAMEPRAADEDDEEPGDAAGAQPAPATPPPTSTSDASRIGQQQVAAATATLVDVAPDRIDPNPSQPRDVFDPEELEGLATSLLDIGVLQPLVVRPAADGRYELIAGERRWRAAQLAGLDTVPVVVRHTDDANLLKEALVENIHRVQLNPLEEAAAYQQLLEEFGVTQEELAMRLGRSRPSISNAIRLLQLPGAVQRRIAAGVLSAGHAKVLLAMDDAGAQTKLAERIIAEGLSVRATEELVRLKLLDGPARAPKARRTPTAPAMIELQEDLSDALEARVRITMGARKGRLAIEFASVDDLERIVGVIAGGISGSGSSREVPAADD